MKFLLDTNTISELMRGNALVVANLTACARDQVGLPQPVVAEIEFGLALLPRGKRRDLLSQRWNLFSRELLRVIWTESVSKQFAVTKTQLRKAGRVVEDLDIAIAAHAIAFELVLVSNNVKHFRSIKSLSLVDWTRQQSARLT